MAAQVQSIESRAYQSKQVLSRQQFALICAAAASRSTNGNAYISNVLAELYYWLRGHYVLAAPPARSVGLENVQALVITLYHLLEEWREIDFDVTGVLNAYSPECCNEDDLY